MDNEILIPEANGTEPVGAAIENLYPALLQCFAIILSGYFAGRTNLISETESKGINTFVGTFALPSLIFMSLAQLELDQVNWTFLLAILIAKSIVFFAVIVVTLLIGSRPLKLSRAGIFAIFCTQSNDFAIGYPIVDALYKHTHPEYATYLYLMAPINLAILNPQAFVLMEIQKKNSNRRLSQNNMLSDSSGEESMSNSMIVHKERFKMAVMLSKNIFLNPIILMTILGIIGNVMFKHIVPIYLAAILNGLGSAFSASALFLLGLRMVGKIHKLRGRTLIIPGVLIMVKLLALPLITRETIALLHSGFNKSETTDLSTYGFFYGTFPSAPGVFVFATQYGIDVDLIASAMVACTFLSAPLMYVSAKMIAVTSCNTADYIKELKAFNLDIGIVGVIACFWILVVFILTKKISKIPHKVTTCLVLSHFVTCLGAILWSVFQSEIQFAVFSIGVYSSRMWTAVLSITLLLLQCRSLCFVLKLIPWFYACGWGLPGIMTAFLIIFGKPTNEALQQTNPNFAYGAPQAILTISLLVLCFVVTSGCLILHQRYRRRYSRYLNLANDIASDFDPLISAEEANSITNAPNTINGTVKPSCSGGNSRKSTCCGGLPTIKEGCCEDKEVISPVVDIEDLLGDGEPPKRSAAEKLANEKRMDQIEIENNEKNAIRRDQNGGVHDSDRWNVPDESPGVNDGCPTKYGCTGPQKQRCEDESPGVNDGCPTKYGCTGFQKQRCKGVVKQYQQPIDGDLMPIEEEPESHDPQILRHVVLLILLLCSMFVALALSIWTLVIEDISGIYVELSFLDVILNLGQSILIFVIFGLDTKEVVLPLIKFWRKIWFGANTVLLPPWDELSNETKHVCDQFVTHHLRNCREAIASDRRWRLTVYKNVFSGTQFVDWLIEVGLARDRGEAVTYGWHLIQGKVLKHINGVYHFHDRHLLYTFTEQ